LLNKIKKLKVKNPNLKITITGCLLEADKKKFKEFLAPYRTKGSGRGFDEIKDIKDFLGSNYLSLEPKCQKQSPAYLPIMTGCNNFCSYCVVPYTRGREISRPMEEIIYEIKKLIRTGHKEITLLGQNVNSYKSKVKSPRPRQAKRDGQKSKIIDFPKLIELIASINGDFTVKFLTSHPKDFSDELIDVIDKSPKISKEIHLPVQSGDDEILKKMNRGYSVQQYLNLIEKIKCKIPNAKITTDVIVGFPEETKKQFENTVKLFKKVGFSMAYVNKYSARAGTPAAHFKDDVPLAEKKRRWKILNDMVNAVQKPKLIVVLGPTASGKSILAIELAKKFNGEIVSADSRQIYKEMDIGTGKIKKCETKGIPHHLLGIVSPRKQFSVAQYRKLALEAIDKIYAKGKIPIICGGTGFYIRAIVDSLIIPEVKPDWKLRKKLEKKTAEELFKELKKLDPQRAKNIDAKNKRRLIRAIEIIKKTGKPVPVLEKQSKFNVLYIGIKKSLLETKKSIAKRIDKMIKTGLEKEVKNLVKKYGWIMVLKNAIGYKEWPQKNPTQAIKSNTYKFAKRQLTWFKKYPGDKIHWILNEKQAKALVEKFLLN